MRPEVDVTEKHRLSSLMIMGGQWGDEGKGKVVDLLSSGFSAVVRYNGGHNAGHTVRFADRRFALHLVPSGIIHSHVICYLASGMVINPHALEKELDRLTDERVSYDGRLMVSQRATMILPTHGALDLAREGARGKAAIGTTGRGIGPAYQDLAQRRALRLFLLTEPERLAQRARSVMEQHNLELTRLFGAEPVDVDQAVDELVAVAKRLGPLVHDIAPQIYHHAESGDPILFEGAQGVMLDILHGTYPYVTSSSCLPGSAAASCGVGSKLLGPVIGVMKAYVTRVGGGPFPTEIEGDEGDRLRERGNEYGTTTGRPRRCGWFDAVAARYAVETAGLNALALTKLDVLDGLDQIKVADAYELADGTVVKRPPADLELLDKVRPRYHELPGWSQPVTSLTDERSLPEAAESYIRFLEELLGIPVIIVSTGARREETMVRGSNDLADQLRPLIG
jgi:adenylosuccinate synthase